MCTNCLSFSVTTISHCSCIAFLILKQAVVTSISSNVRLCVIGGKIIYPKELGQVVKNIGGYQFVKQNRKWQDVRRSLGLPEISSFGHQINKAYLAYFGPQAKNELQKKSHCQTIGNSNQEEINSIKEQQNELQKKLNLLQQMQNNQNRLKELNKLNKQEQINELQKKKVRLKN